MTKIRRVGTFTLGSVLVIAGILFIVRMFVPALSYEVIFGFWPCVLILLGAEILFSLFRKKEDTVFKYDFAAVLIIFMTVGFSMCMAFVDFLMAHEEFWRNI
ncbi:MAG: hypothetical protein IJM37_01795 [Lachnospiraceae bacterium]|nr:hypothetical protein [Lachnospiraceae bacterium]